MKSTVISIFLAMGIQVGFSSSLAIQKFDRGNMQVRINHIVIADHEPWVRAMNLSGGNYFVEIYQPLYSACGTVSGYRRLFSSDVFVPCHSNINMVLTQCGSLKPISTTLATCPTVGCSHNSCTPGSCSHTHGAHWNYDQDYNTEANEHYYHMEEKIPYGHAHRGERNNRRNQGHRNYQDQGYGQRDQGNGYGQYNDQSGHTGAAGRRGSSSQTQGRTKSIKAQQPSVNKRSLLSKQKPLKKRFVRN